MRAPVRARAAELWTLDDMWTLLRELIDEEYPITMRTRLPLVETERRLADVIRRTPLPILFTGGLVGSLKHHRLVIRRHRPFHTNSFSPVLDVTLQRNEDYTDLVGHYRLHRYVRVLLTIWFSFWAMFLGIALFFALIALRTADSLLPIGIFIVVPFLMGLSAIAAVKRGKRSARGDDDYIQVQLKEAIGADVI